MKNRLAFTLIEVLVAITIFAIAAVTLFVVFPASSMTVRQAREYTDVALLMESYLAEIEATPFNQIQSREITSGLPAYVQRVQVNATSVSGTSELKLVELKATYLSKGRTREASVKTYVSSR